MDEEIEENTHPESTDSTDSVETKVQNVSDTGNRAASGTAGSSRDLMVSTLMHLMGLPSSKQLGVLERKVDALAGKLTALSLKIDRYAGKKEDTEIDGVLERIDLQIADLRNLIKTVLPKAMVADGDVLISDDDVLVHKDKNKTK